MQELNKTWLITGVCGQDGSYLCDYLLELGYTNIHGIIRRASTFNTGNINHIFDKLQLHYGDLTDSMNIHTIISKVKPNYIVNFGAMSHVKTSHELENYTFQTNTLGILNILQSVRNLGMEKSCKIYQASTSEIFGNSTDGSSMLTEKSRQDPVSIYGISKMAAQQICNLYRDAYGMFVVNSLLFNHESPRRGGTFVTQKIAEYVSKYDPNKYISSLELGNLNAKRDWSCAKKFIEAVYLMLIADKPNNYVIASGETHSVKEFVELAFSRIGVDINWNGTGVDEIGYDTKNKKVVVRVNKRYYRDIDIECLIGNSNKAKTELDWEYNKKFKDLVNEMVDFALSK
jgi:GDPmannose 4,6-dehydratase